VRWKTFIYPVLLKVMDKGLLVILVDVAKQGQFRLVGERENESKNTFRSSVESQINESQGKGSRVDHWNYIRKKRINS
jgi:hypothetical protein